MIATIWDGKLDQQSSMDVVSQISLLPNSESIRAQRLRHLLALLVFLRVVEGHTCA